MLQEPKFLSATQFLLTTLVVKLAAMAALATMLARYRRFRHILIFEQRNWPDRLVFALGLGVPLPAGVAARVLLNYDAADLMLEGAFLAGLIAGPYTGALVGLAIAMPALAAGEYGAPFFAVGCGFAGGGLREACPKEEIWSFSPFVLLSVPRYIWRMVRRVEVNWPVVLLLAIIGLETVRQAVGARYSTAPVPAVEPVGVDHAARLSRDHHHGVDADQDLEQRPHRASPAGAGKAAARRQGRGPQEPDQPALPVQHPDVGVVADPARSRKPRAR